MSGITADAVPSIAPAAFVGLCAQLDALTDDAALNVTSAQLVAMGGAAGCTGDTLCRFLHRISDNVVASVNDAAFNAKLVTCGLAGWQLVDTLVVVVCGVVLFCCFVCICLFIVRRARASARGDYKAINSSSSP